MSIYNFSVKDSHGKEVSMENYKDYVMLIVNTASKCGLTPQFEGLEELYKEYKDKKFVVLGFPCNQFASQDPGTNEEITGFCKLNYGVTFPMMAKIDVNGKDADPLYVWLKKEKSGFAGGSIKWNFTKFLIDREGNVVDRFGPREKPENLKEPIEKLL